MVNKELKVRYVHPPIEPGRAKSRYAEAGRDANRPPPRLIIGRTDSYARARNSKDKAQVTQTSRLNERRAAREVEEMEIEIKNLKEQLVNQNVSRSALNIRNAARSQPLSRCCLRRGALPLRYPERPGLLLSSPRADPSSRPPFLPPFRSRETLSTKSAEVAWLKSCRNKSQNSRPR